MISDAFLQELTYAAEVTTAALALVIVIASADDLLMDLWYWSARVLRWLRRAAPAPAPSTDALRAVPERPIAVLVPAWQEENVIGAMLRNALARIEYDSHVFFVGTYPNDPGTTAEVERLARTDPRVRRVQVSHPGPTCKADCLNQVVAAAFEHEQRSGVPFAAMVLHDSEDVIHPLELKMFNHELDSADMIQLPVVPLRRPGNTLVAGTYTDEFAECHGKEMLVREQLCGCVPSAGVGTCFSRAAMVRLWNDSRGLPFRTDSLTEDYEVGMRLAELGMRSRFVVMAPDDPQGSGSRAERLIAVREFFPDRIRTLSRQKARWILGIGLQSWRQLPVLGRPLPIAYLLLRDRKGIVSAIVPLGAYVLLLYFLVFLLGVHAGWWSPYEPVLFTPGSIWEMLLYVNGVLLLVRAASRFYFTAALHGAREGLLSLPRLVVGNIANGLATLRAWRIYLTHCISGKPLAWDKTAHDFPADADIDAAQQTRSGPAVASLAAQRAAAPALRRAARVRPAAQRGVSRD